MIWLADALALLGTAIISVAVVGIYRLPELPARLHAGATAAPLGAVLVVAAALPADDLWLAARALLVIGALFVTAPLSSSALMRIALRETDE